MNKPLYLGMSILDISKTLMYKLWYDYIKPKYGREQKYVRRILIAFSIHIMSEYFLKDISDEVKIWFDTSNYDENDKRPIPIGENKKEPGFFKDELGGEMMTEVCVLRDKTWTHRMDDDSKKKKAKGTKNTVIKRLIRYGNYIDSLCNDMVILRSQQRFKSDHHELYTEEVNKVSLSSYDDKRYKHLIGLRHFHTEQMNLKYAKAK